jgi:hypothetical protein
MWNADSAAFMACLMLSGCFRYSLQFGNTWSRQNSCGRVSLVFVMMNSLPPSGDGVEAWAIDLLEHFLDHG